METLCVDERLVTGVAQLDPSGDLNKGIAKLLLIKERRDLTKYELMCRNFKRKYECDFAIFKKRATEKELGHKEEQDFFDWDMAITGIVDIKEKIDSLEGLMG
ncbi:MAG: hypothetical protein AAB267_01915 [Candidatus Desantisbacteria bacterium]